MVRLLILDRICGAKEEKKEEYLLMRILCWTLGEAVELLSCHTPPGGVYYRDIVAWALGSDRPRSEVALPLLTHVPT